MHAARIDAGMSKMSADPIVEEIHTIREALSKESDDDIRKIAEAAR